MKLKSEPGASRLIAIIEPRSNTMKLGIHQQHLVDACQKGGYGDLAEAREERAWISMPESPIARCQDMRFLRRMR